MLRITGIVSVMLTGGLAILIFRGIEVTEFTGHVLSVGTGKLQLLHSEPPDAPVPLSEDNMFKVTRTLFMADVGAQKIRSVTELCTLQVPLHVSSVITIGNGVTIRQEFLGSWVRVLAIRHTSFHQDMGGNAVVHLRPRIYFWGACAILSALPLLAWGVVALLVAALVPGMKRPRPWST